MFGLYRRIRWLYQSFYVSVWLPFAILILYTILGACIFRAAEREKDQQIRLFYRKQTEYALDQVVHRMLEVHCQDQVIRASKELQLQHAKEAIIWFLDHLNLTEVIDERTKDTPWDWMGAMFYAGQLYTTIGYGYPITKTPYGRIASIFYILFGIPMFLLILKDMGRIMSRALRKFYKRLRQSKRKIEYASKKVFRTAPLDQKTAIISSIEMEKQNKDNAKRHAQDASFPISIALCMLVFWILLSAALLNFWETEWGFMTSVYFYFVSISTVGLGDIVFLNTDMMIYNFLLILVGLALLSMCFNLIQTGLEKMFNRLLDEYIEEIEKMAQEVTVNESCMEEAMPLEFKMTGNLLTLPIKRVANETGFLAEAKGWMAGRIANKVLTKRLGIDDSESDEDEEVESEETQQTQPDQDAEAAHVPTARSMSNATKVSRGSIPKARNLNRLRGNARLLNAVRTLEKIKPQKNDMRSMIFSKFLQSDKLGMLVDDENKKSKMVTTSCQTDPDPETDSQFDKIKWRKRGGFNRKESCTSFTTIGTNSVFVDDESLLSAAYCDLKFDYSAEPPIASPPSQVRSSLSILKLDDDEPLLPSKLSSVLTTWQPTVSPWKTAQLRVQTSNLAAVHEVPSPVPTISSQVTSPIMMKYPSASDISSGSKTEEELDGLDKVRQSCGLLPKDFDVMSSSSKSAQSNMADSGYERSQHDDATKSRIESIAEDGEQNEQQALV